MARAFWKGVVSFGLVEIPVGLRPADRTNEMSFSLLDKQGFSPVGFKRYNKKTGREVPWDRVVRGYEYEPDEYVVLSDEELRTANVRATQTIDIVQFVDRNDIDPVFFESPYFVEPQKRGSKSYALLRSALERTGKMGIAQVVLRTRQHMAALLVRDGVLMLVLLRYAEELKPPADLAVSGKNGAEAKLSKREIDMAARLIEGMRGAWKPEQYRDEYRRDVMALVKRKVKSGKTHTIVEPSADSERPRARGEIVDLMPLLEQSLNRGRRGTASPSRAKRVAKPRRSAPVRRRA